jgi:hypothetical protein
MIAFPPGVRVWLATGHTDMRKGFPSLALHATILAERAARLQAEATGARAAIAKAEAANAQADLSSRDALIAHLKLKIEKLRRWQPLGAQGAAP